ncbi:hypothetical protein EVAR_34544_1 [Eumeta japonica]|uniref:Uncharacterized protein n=1 Tax=Eumeta variegata TaxID=151549 RepID=A0A4C1X6M1_EUMVA|nr:hypothetical protein EVAR_34544_1 [Eumeta japonica]
MIGAIDTAKLKTFFTESEYFDVLRDFEVYCSSPASHNQRDPVSDPDMEVKINPYHTDSRQRDVGNKKSSETSTASQPAKVKSRNIPIIIQRCPRPPRLPVTRLKSLISSILYAASPKVTFFVHTEQRSVD